VVGVGIGYKFRADARIGEEKCLRVYVSRKPKREDLSTRQLIPEKIGEFETDIIEVGEFFAARPGLRKNPPARDQRTQGTPQPGSSIGLKVGTAPNYGKLVSGTLGAIVSDAGGKSYVLSCNHVLSVNGRVDPNDPDAQIMSPAPEDDPSGIRIATRPTPVLLKHDEYNEADCAVAEIVGSMKKKVEPRFPDLDTPVTHGLDAPKLGQRVFKFGKASGKTYGEIVDVCADIIVDYSFGTFRFKNQVLIRGFGGDFAAQGDSGAVVLLEEPGQPVSMVAMVFAPIGRFTAACPMKAVFDSLTMVFGGKATRLQRASLPTFPFILPKKVKPGRVPLVATPRVPRRPVAKRAAGKKAAGKKA
jgi:hypothetical protein